MLLIVDQSMDPVVCGISVFYFCFFHALYFWELLGDFCKVTVHYELSMCLHNNVIPFFPPSNLTVCWYNLIHPHIDAAALKKKWQCLKIAKYSGKLSCIEEVKPLMLPVVTVLGNVYYDKMCS